MNPENPQPDKNDLDFQRIERQNSEESLKREKSEKDKASKDVSKIAAILISSLSLVVSLTTLYFSQLAPSKTSFFIGREILLYYPREGGFGIYIPITSVNVSNNTGVVKQISITLTKAGSDTNYFFNWVAYGYLDPASMSWNDEVIAHPIVIPGKSSHSKTYWFVWRPTSQPKVLLSPGTYTFKLYAIADSGEQLRYETNKTLTLSDLDIAALEERRANKGNETARFFFNEGYEENAAYSGKKLRKKVKE